MQISQRGSSESVKDVRRAFQIRNSNFLRKAKRSADFFKFSDAQLEILDCLSGEKDPTRDLLSSNIVARQRMATFIARRLKTIRETRPKAEIAHVTIFDTAWETSDEITEIDLVGMKTAIRPVLKAIAPNFLAVAEIQAFANVRHPLGGVVLSLHTHAICWGEDIVDSAQTAVAAHQSRFRTRFLGAEPIRLDWVEDTAVSRRRVAQYPWKLSDRCKTHYQDDATNPTKSNLHESEANDRMVRYLRLQQIHSLIEIDRLIYGGGEGRGVRADALRSANQALSLLQVGTPPVHPDAIAHFWVEAMSKPELARFKLPFIRYRKG